MLELCGSYLFQGGLEQIGANSSAGVYFTSQHAAEAWASHRGPSLASTPNRFMLGKQTFAQLTKVAALVAGAELSFFLFCCCDSVKFCAFSWLSANSPTVHPTEQLPLLSCVQVAADSLQPFRAER